VTNMCGPGDTLLACPTGVFGERIATIAKMWGCTVETLETPWGAGVDPGLLVVRLNQMHPSQRYETAEIRDFDRSSKSARARMLSAPPKLSGRLIFGDDAPV
jgi:hypothetical protein